MMIVAGDYIVNTFEGTEQYAKPHWLVAHPLYNGTTNNADIMLIKVLQCYQCLALWFALINLKVVHESLVSNQSKWAKQQIRSRVSVV